MQAGDLTQEGGQTAALSDEQLGERFKISAAQIQGRLNGMNKKLLAARSSRLRPDTDDKVLVAWNGLALVAFAEAARYSDRGDYLDLARQTADFLLRELYTGERLLRSWRNGQAKHNAYLEDYAALILGLIALYQSDPNLRWYRTAVLLAEEMLNHFFIEGDGFYDTRDDQETLILRPRDIQDNATPSGSAMACRALYELAIFDGPPQISITRHQINYDII